jgi:hypothetical protein
MYELGCMNLVAIYFYILRCADLSRQHDIPAATGFLSWCGRRVTKWFCHRFPALVQRETERQQQNAIGFVPLRLQLDGKHALASLGVSRCKPSVPVGEVRRLREEGKGLAEIADALGVSRMASGGR